MLKIKKLSQLKKSFRSVTLGCAQKNASRETVVAYMKTHPVRISEDARQKAQTSAGNLFKFLTQKHMYATLAIILTLLTGTGTAFAAENTVPGDPLYGVKVHVNENVRGALAIGDNAKSEWATRVTERRLDEATKLAANGELSVEAEAALKARITKQTEKIQTHIEALKASGNIEAASNVSAHLETVLDIHGQILSALNDDTTTSTRENLKPLLRELKDAKKEIQEIHAKIDSDVKTHLNVDSKTAAENRMNASQNHIDGVQKFLDDKNVSATSSAKVKLNEAIKIQAQGKGELEDGNFGKAFALFGQAQKTAQEAKIMVHVGLDLKVDAQVHKALERIHDKKIQLSDDAKIKLEDLIRVKAEDRIENKIEERQEQRLEIRGKVESDIKSGINL